MRGLRPNGGVADSLCNSVVQGRLTTCARFSIAGDKLGVVYNLGVSMQPCYGTIRPYHCSPQHRIE